MCGVFFSSLKIRIFWDRFLVLGFGFWVLDVGCWMLDVELKLTEKRTKSQEPRRINKSTKSEVTNYKNFSHFIASS
jgi:hypothetical protein